MPPVLPNLFLVGVNKGGTTALARFLGSHPEIFMSPVKEPCFFSLTEDGVQVAEPNAPDSGRFVTDPAEYEALFDGVTDEPVVAEASTMYLHTPRAAREIRRAVPHAKILGVLRDPAARAYSSHGMHVARGLEPLTRFDDAVDAELAGGDWRYNLSMSRYSESVARYLDLFGPEQVKFFLHRDLTGDPARVLREIFEWLGIDPDHDIDLSGRYNETRLARSAAADRAISRPSMAKSVIRRALPPAARRRIKQRVVQLNQVARGAHVARDAEPTHRVLP